MPTSSKSQCVSSPSHPPEQTWARKSAKLLAAIALLATTGFAAKAEEATFTCKDKLGTQTIDTVTEWKPSTDFTFTFAKNEGKSTPAYNKAGDIRLYAKNSANLIANNDITIQKVVFNISKQGKERLTEITADKGTIATQASGDTTVNWTGDASDITFTVSDTLAIYGTKSGKLGQLCFDKVTITYTLPASSKEPANIAFNPESVTIDLGDAFEAPVLTKDTDAPIAWDSTDKTVATVDAFGNVTVLAVGTTDITATAAENDNFYGGSASYKLTVNDPNSIYSNACTSSASGFTKWSPEGSTNPWSFDSRYGMKATGYMSDENTVTDGIMASPVLDLTNRKNATLKFNQAVNQFKGSDGKTNLSGDEMTAILEDISVVIAEVSTDEMPTEWSTLTEPALTLPETQGWSFYAQEPMDLTAYAGKKIRIGFRYVSTTDRAGTWEIKNVNVTGEKKDTTVGIAGIEAENGEAVYFNLQGVRVQNPEKGIFIRVQNGKATKIMK